MPTIRKLILQNFKQFGRLDLEFDERHNVLIGDNETGKSSVLLALDLALSGSRNRVENLGFEALFCKSVIEAFLDGPRSIDQLPTLVIDVFWRKAKTKVFTVLAIWLDRRRMAFGWRLSRCRTTVRRFVQCLLSPAVIFHSSTTPLSSRPSPEILMRASTDQCAISC